MNELTSSESERFEVRYPLLQKRNAPPGYLELDRALNLLGHYRFPDKWGSSSAWLYLPYKYDRKGKVHRRYIQEKAKLFLDGEVISGYEKEELRECRKYFLNIVKELYGALKEKRIGALKFFEDNSPSEELDFVRDSFLIRKRITLMLTAYGSEKIGIRDRKFRILINQNDLSKYFGKSINITDNRKRPLSSFCISRMRDVLIKFYGVKINRYLFEELRELINDTMCPLFITKERLRKELWRGLPWANDSGARTSTQRQEFEDARSDLAKALKKCL